MYGGYSHSHSYGDSSDYLSTGSWSVAENETSVAGNKSLGTTAPLPIMTHPLRSVSVRQSSAATERQAAMLKDKRKKLYAMKRNQTLANHQLQAEKQEKGEAQEPYNIRIFKEKNSPKVGANTKSGTKHLSPIQETPRSRTVPPVLPYRPPKTPKTTVIQATRKPAYSQDSYDDYDDDNDLFFDCAQIQSAMENGPLRFRFFVFLGSLFMLAASYMDYQQEVYYSYYGYNDSSISPLFFLITIYIWVFGAFIATLEILPFQMSISKFHRVILKYLNIMRYTWGRGFLYLFSGSLQFSLFTNWNMYAGGYMMVMGIISIIIGRVASKKLKVLVKKIRNSTNLMDAFSQYDKDRDGYLNIHEFRRLVKDTMGRSSRGHKNRMWSAGKKNKVQFTDDECVNAFRAIDANNDRRLTFRELSEWFATAKYEAKRRGDGVLI